MKKLILGIGFAVAVAVTAYSQYNQGASFSVPAPQVVSTNITSTGIAPAYLLLTNRAEVINVQIVNNNGSSALLYIYDNGSLTNAGTGVVGGTNSVIGSYVSTSSYSTNYATSYIGYNGFTNYYTNVGLWTFTVTNTASTNNLIPAAVFAVAANTVATYPSDIFCEKGVVVQATTNMTLTMYYRPAR